MTIKELLKSINKLLKMKIISKDDLVIMIEAKKRKTSSICDITNINYINTVVTPKYDYIPNKNKIKTYNIGFMEKQHESKNTNQ